MFERVKGEIKKNIIVILPYKMVEEKDRKQTILFHPLVSLYYLFYKIHW